MSSFLATTALPEFWDTSRPVVFLGSWCLRYDRRIEWESLDYGVMPCPWDDRKRFYEAARYADECGERMLKSLADYLNSIHGVSYSQRYWRILIGPWLLHYVPALYDRYVHLGEAISRYPGFRTIVLDSQSFRTPADAAGTVSLILDDPYNLQLFSQLLRQMGHSFPSRSLRSSWATSGEGAEGFGTQTVGRKLKERGLRFAETLVRHARGARVEVGLCGLRTPYSSIWRLAWKTDFRVLPVRIEAELSFPTAKPVFDDRRNGLASLPWMDPFERILVQSFPQNFPSLYFEGYSLARAATTNCRPLTVPVIVSDSAWYFHEPFKYWAAEAMEKGSRLVSVQRGGGYGTHRISSPELHETRLADSFITWGWASKDGRRSWKLPNPRLCLLSRQAAKYRYRRPEMILFVGTAHPRYLYRFHSTPADASQWGDYFEWQIRFLEGVPRRYRHAILFRPYPYDYGYGVRERIATRFGDLRWDDGAPMGKRLQQVRLVAIDHHATTFLESLAANVPTVMFWDPDRWEVREDAAPYFEELREVGILWNSPEGAAGQISQLYDDPRPWWGSGPVQRARERFAERYALVRHDWLDYWIAALEEEIALTRLQGEH